jgi:twinkle protein
MDSSIAKIDAYRARQIGEMLITQGAEEWNPERVLLDVGAMNGRELMDKYTRRHARFGTAPFDMNGDLLRFYPGGVTIWSGFPGAGKTTILRQTICHFLNRGSSVFLASLEEDPADVLVRLAATAAASEPTAKQMQAFIDEYQKRFRMWGIIGIANHRQLLAVIAQLAKEGIRHAVIDSLMCLDVANDDFEGQRKFANLVAATARAAQIHIHLVAHPRKLVSANQELDLNDVAGARELGGVADNVLFVQRQVGQAHAYGPSADVTPMCVAIKKQRHFNGALTNIEGWFNRGWKQFHREQFPDGPLRYLPREAYETPFAGAPSWTA